MRTPWTPFAHQGRFHHGSWGGGGARYDPRDDRQTGLLVLFLHTPIGQRLVQILPRSKSGGEARRSALEHPEAVEECWMRGCFPIRRRGGMILALKRTNTITMTTTDRYLKDISELLIDSKLGYGDTSRRTDDPRLTDLLTGIGQGRIDKIATVSGLLEDRGIRPPLSGTFKGMLHRVWIAIRDVVAHTDDVNMISECLRGESYLIGRVDAALRDEGVTEEVKEVLRVQREELMDNLERINLLNMSISEG